MLALTRSLPGVRYQYCLFHYVQMIRRAIKKLKMRHLYANADFKRYYQGLTTLPFLPVDEVKRALYELQGRFNGSYHRLSELDRAKMMSEFLPTIAICDRSFS